MHDHRRSSAQPIEFDPELHVDLGGGKIVWRDLWVDRSNGRIRYTWSDHLGRYEMVEVAFDLRDRIEIGAGPLASEAVVGWVGGDDVLAADLV